MYIIFDTETNGLPKKYNMPMADLDNWPRVIQLGWICHDADGKVTENKYFIKPDGWTIPKDDFFIDKGYTTERCEKEGVPMKIVLQILMKDINRSQYMIAHNIDFDHNVLGAEMIRYGVTVKVKTKKFCTMKSSTDLCQIEGPYGYKWPKLEELHRFLFNEEFSGAHDAMSDCQATAKCFFELVKRGIIIINNPLKDKESFV